KHGTPSGSRGGTAVLTLVGARRGKERSAHRLARRSQEEKPRAKAQDFACMRGSGLSRYSAVMNVSAEGYIHVKKKLIICSPIDPFSPGPDGPENLGPENSLH